MKNKIKEKKNKIKSSSLFTILRLPHHQGFSSRETDFHFCQFLSNFFKYLSLNFLLSYPNNNFTVYFPSNSLLLSFSALGFNFTFHILFISFCHLTSVLILLLNSFTNSFAFSKSFSFSHVLFPGINPFQYTKYFSISHIFLLFNIFSTSYFSTLSTSTSFASSIFCPSTCSLYYTTWLTFMTRWILIDIGSHNLTVLVETTLSIICRLIYWSTNFFASHFLNTRSFVLSIILSLFFRSSTSFLSLSACCFIFS